MLARVKRRLRKQKGKKKLLIPKNKEFFVLKVTLKSTAAAAAAGTAAATAEATAAAAETAAEAAAAHTAAEVDTAAAETESERQREGHHKQGGQQILQDHGDHHHLQGL